MVDNIKLTVIAHDVIVNNHIDRATDIMKFCYEVYRSYEVCEKIFVDSFKQRMKEIIHDPITFVGEQASGIYHASIAAAKAVYRLDQVRRCPIQIIRDENGWHLEPHENLQALMDFSDLIARKMLQFVEMTPEQRGEVVKKALEMSGRIGADTVSAWPLFTGASKICRPIAQVVKTKLSPDQLQRLEYVERSANTIDMVFDETAQAYVMKEVVAGELIPIAASAELVPLAPVISQAVEEGAGLANAAKSAAAGNVAKNTTALVEKQRELLQTLDKIKEQKIVTEAIAQSPCKELFAKYEPLVDTAQKYGISNAEEALQVLQVNEHRLAKFHEPFALIDRTAKDLQKINSNPRWEKFKYDAAKGNSITYNSIQEALAGIACEEQGLLSNLKRGSNIREDFIDKFGQLWDVKTARSISLTGEDIFNAKRFIKSILEKITPEENIILETTYLNDKQLSNLYSELVYLPKEILKKIMIINAYDPQKSASINNTYNFLQEATKHVF